MKETKEDKWGEIPCTWIEKNNIANVFGLDLDIPFKFDCQTCVLKYKTLDQHCPAELPVKTEMLCIYADTIDTSHILFLAPEIWLLWLRK